MTNNIQYGEILGVSLEINHNWLTCWITIKFGNNIQSIGAAALAPMPVKDANEVKQRITIYRGD